MGCFYQFEYMVVVRIVYMNLICGKRFSNLYLYTLKSCVTGVVLKNKNVNFQVISIKSRLIFNVSYYGHTTQKFVHTKINAYSNECI